MKNVRTRGALEPGARQKTKTGWKKSKNFEFIKERAISED